jgi:hypothetical protein
MDAGISAALIGSGGAVLGAMITAFAPELVALLRKKSKASKLIDGEWICEWAYDTATYKGLDQYKDKVINDNVVVDRVRGSQIHASSRTGKDRTIIGEYVLRGEISYTNIVTLVYSGKEKNGLVGTVILKLNFTQEEMQGYWVQINPEGNFVGGATRWTKKK